MRIRPTFIDRAISYVSPERGVARYRARLQLAIAGQWFGGRTDRRETAGWLPPAGSADDDNLQDLPNTRSRSRDLQRNSPLGLGATNAHVTNVAATGLALRSKVNATVLKMTPDQAQEWQRATEQEFCLFADSALACDAEAATDFYQMQGLALRSALDSGDVFALLPMIDRRGSTYATKVQLVEADRVCNKDNAPDTDRLAAGIETDRYGAPVSYHFLSQHPRGLFYRKSKDWTVVPAFGSLTGRRNVVHLFEKRRPGQRRGMPYLAPVIETLRQLSEYSNNELRASVVSSLLTVFVKAPTGAGLALDATGAAPTTTPQSGDGIKLGSGAIVDLAPGEEVELVNPTRPNVAFDPFVLAVLRQIGAALEIPHEIIIKHFTASYSASKAAFNEAWRFFRLRRAWLASGFCQPIYEAWLEEAIAQGRIVAPGFFDDPMVRLAYCGAEWIGDAPGSIDPEKDVNAAEKRLNLLLSTHADEQMELRGGDWEETIARREREDELIARAGLKPAQVAPPSGTPANNDEMDDRPDDELPSRAIAQRLAVLEQRAELDEERINLNAAVTEDIAARMNALENP